MSTEQAAVQTPITTPLPDANNPAPNPAPEVPKTEQSAETPETKPEGNEGELLFGKKEGDSPDPKKADDKPEKPDAKGQRDYLKDKIDAKELEGKSDADIEKMFDEQKAKEQAEADAGPKVDFTKLKTSDGSEIDAPNMEWLKKYAGDNKLTQEQTQALVDKGAEINKHIADQWTATKTSWTQETKNDPVIGGKNLPQTQASVERLITKFASDPAFGGSPELIRSLQEDLILLGLGRKRSFITMMNNIAKATGEDKMEGTPGAAPIKASLAERMWPDMAGDKK